MVFLDELLADLRKITNQTDEQTMLFVQSNMIGFEDYKKYRQAFPSDPKPSECKFIYEHGFDAFIELYKSLLNINHLQVGNYTDKLNKQNMSFKKDPTIEELKAEVEALQEQAVNGNARFNALKKQYDNHPAQTSLEKLECKVAYAQSKWSFRLFNKWFNWGL